MNLKISYFDNKLEFSSDYINVMEIENRKYFYRLVNDFYELMRNGLVDDLIFFDSAGSEKNMNNKIKVYIDYFNFDFDSKKTSNDICKYISNAIDDNNKILLQNEYNKIVKLYKKMINNIDIPLSIDEDINIESLSKLLKISIDAKSQLLDNLFLLIDLEREFITNNILIFINLKQYLSKSELIELYKYAIYNKVQILLIDSQCYGVCLEYEKKLILDENFDEFVL